MRTTLEDFSSLGPKAWNNRRVAIGAYVALCYAAISAIVFYIPVYVESSGNMAWVNNRHFLFVALFSFLGCVLYISLKFVNGVKTGDMPIRWYILRPFQSILLSFFIYLAVRSGQLVFFSGGESMENNINMYSMGLAAALTGIFSEQAYVALEAIAKKMFKVVDKSEPKPEPDPDDDDQYDEDSDDDDQDDDLD